MKAVLSPEPSGGSHSHGHEKIVVTIFYPDATYGAQLVGAFHRAVGSLGQREALDPRPWRLDVLQWPEMQAEATHDIANSRIVVVPADDAYASSDFFRRWVEAWPAALDGQRLLLVPRRGAADTPPRVRQFVQWLQEICTEKGMGFGEAKLAEVLTTSALDQGVMDSTRAVSPLAPPQQLDMLATHVPEWEKPMEPRFWDLNEWMKQETFQLNGNMKQSVTQLAKGEAEQTFSIRAPGARSAHLAADFTEWQQRAIPMKPLSDGLWSTAITLPAGTYEYRFLVDGEWRDDPECTLRAPNSYGTQNMVRVVPEVPPAVAGNGPKQVPRRRQANRKREIAERNELVGGRAWAA